MILDEIFETEFSIRKTVWSKRGDKIARRSVDLTSPTDIQSRKYIEVKKEDSDVNDD